MSTGEASSTTGTTTSADGTTIAYRTVGTGPPVVIVGGALSTAAAGLPLATALGDAGLQGVCLDRRARGGSGDTAPYAPEREVEDLAAVVAAVGDGTTGPAALLGHSSGAVLSLLAVSAGVPVRHLFLSEPPLSWDEGHGDPGMADRLQAMVDAGQEEEAVATFLLENVGLSKTAVTAMRADPSFAHMLPLARSTVYDTRLVTSVSPPTAAMLAVEVPTTVLRGEPTYPDLVAAADRLSETLPRAELVVVPESSNHSVDPVGTTREVVARLRPEPG